MICGLKEKMVCGALVVIENESLSEFRLIVGRGKTGVVGILMLK